MGLKRGNYTLFVTLCFASVFLGLVHASEFVPVYAWGTQKVTERTPALHRVTEDSFRDDVFEKLKSNTFIVVFAEETLSPEDFSERDQSHERTYSNLFKLRNSAKVSYLPYVQNPIKALKNLNRKVEEVSVERYLQNPEIPQSNVILIVNLNDAQDQEERFSMLRRHDAVIAEIYENVLKHHKNVLAFYTSRHISWAGAENIESRKVRSLLQAKDESSAITYFGNCIKLYTSGKSNLTTLNPKESVNVTLTFTEDCSKEENTIHLTGEDATQAITVEFEFKKYPSKYWILESFNVTKNKDTNIISLTDLKDIVYAPVGFSYHCSSQVYKNQNASFSLPDFQIQPFGNGTHEKFGDAYDCVGFTTIPIWSGLFVTSILLLILTFGLTMMIDIKTMDRFDDAKGKTITINTSE